jgi:undecaprenyl phosphate-alpha-L-ara4FN deformylase
MRMGLRIDVDTYRGTRIGVPNLCRLLADVRIRGTFFFSVGPDNMGRHVYRLLRPVFLKKMLRSHAVSLYGWDILLRGTVMPGPLIGKKLAACIKVAAEDGHEIGLHAWDHHGWQTGIGTMTAEEIRMALQNGFQSLARIIGRPPVCSAVPAWKCTTETLCLKTDLPFVFNSDCRGESIFYPIVNGTALPQPQIPVTLPTYDEVIGKNGITHENYNDYILSQIMPGQLNVYCIHAEVEGIGLLQLFRDLLQAAADKGIRIVPLGSLLNTTAALYMGRMSRKHISGRDGWVSMQHFSDIPHL